MLVYLVAPPRPAPCFVVHNNDVPPMKNLLLFLLLCLLGRIASAQDSPGTAQATTGSPYFQMNVEGATFPLKSTTAAVNISGVIADVTVTQTYVNDGENRLEATYVFPGSTNAAVYGMTMIVGNRRIKGEIQRKAQARETYEKAKEEGKRASLLEQHRPNVFQMNVANILPGDTVRVELKYTELLMPTGGTYAFTYPTVVGPRYVADSDRATESYTAQAYTNDSEPTYDFDLEVYLNAGLPINMIGSPTHKLATSRREGGASVTLDASETKGGNRDFVLEYNLQGNTIQTGMITYEGEDANYFLYMAQPPATTTEGDYPPREYIFVIDVSGSMTGWPLDISKELLMNLTSELRPVDEFNLLLFAGTGATWKSKSVPATQAYVEEAQRWLTNNLQGGGGTELINALNIAYALPRTTQGLSRNIVIATDGYVHVEPEAFDLIRDNLNEANVYSFGIGTGVNRHLIDGMARVGRGRPTYVLDPNEAKAKSDRFRAYISKPVLTQAQLDFGDKFEAYDVEPISIPDISTERPLVVFGKYRGKPRGKAVLTGYGGYVGLNGTAAPPTSDVPTEADKRHHMFTYDLREARHSDRHAALAQLWARERIRRLDDYNGLRYGGDTTLVKEITQLGLDYNLLTQYTSFVAVEEVIAADPDTPLDSVNQPLPLPQNVAATAVGFDLGVIGIAGLPKGTSPHWGWYALFGITVLVIVWRAYTKKGWPDFSGMGSPKDLVPLFLLCSLSIFLCTCDSARTTHAAATTHECSTGPDRKITFILGEDEGTNPYYARATEYFRQHPDEAGEQVVTHLTSLAEAHDYLARTQVPHGWEKINVVAHGNQWTGLAAKLTPTDGASRVTGNALANWSPDRPLPSGTITDRTEIFVHGCSVGRDTALLLQLSRVFAGRGHAYPTVSASEDFTLFREGASGVERHYADYVYRARPLGNYPLPEVMANRLRRQHPEKRVDWDEALTNNRFTEQLQPHLYQFNVPVRWTRVYPQDDKAVVPTNTNAWLQGEHQLVQTLDKMGFTPRDFLWDFTAGDYPLADGDRIPAITANGVARLFCVLLPRSTDDPTTMVRLRYTQS